MAQTGYSLAFARDMIPAKMKPYSSSLPPIYQKFQGGYLGIGASGRGVEVLAGDWGERSLMLGRFPSPQAVADFWWSPEYRAAAALREGAVRVEVCRLAGEAPRDGDRVFLVAVFGPVENAAAEALLTTLVRTAGPEAGVVVAAAPASVELLEGEALAGHAVLILGYETPAELASGWAALRPLLEAGDVAVNAYSLARATPPA